MILGSIAFLLMSSGASAGMGSAVLPVNPYPSGTVYGKRFAVGQLLGYTWSGMKETAA